MTIEKGVFICLAGENGNHGDADTANVMLEDDDYLHIEDTSDEEFGLSLNPSEQKNLLKVLINIHGIPA